MLIIVCRFIVINSYRIFQKDAIKQFIKHLKGKTNVYGSTIK
mgnify:CR=1 FL=1